MLLWLNGLIPTAMTQNLMETFPEEWDLLEKQIWINRHLGVMVRYPNTSVHIVYLKPNNAIYFCIYFLGFITPRIIHHLTPTTGITGT